MLLKKKRREKKDNKKSNTTGGGKYFYRLKLNQYWVVEGHHLAKIFCRLESALYTPFERNLTSHLFKAQRLTDNFFEVKP